MSQWMRVSWPLPMHAATFTITNRLLLVSHAGIADLLSGAMRKEEPALISEVLAKLVLAERPELAGCQPWFIEYDVSRAVWKVSVEHPSLPACGLYDRPLEMPLEKEPAQ